MEKTFFKSIRTRLTFWFLIIALLPLLIVLLITYEQRTEVIESRSFDKLTAIRDLKVNQLKNWLAEREGDIKIISRDFELGDLDMILNNSNPRKINDTKVLLREYFNNYLKQYTAYDEFFVLHPQTGIVLISTNINSEGTDKSDTEYFRRAQETRNMFIKDIYYSNALSKISMIYSAPIIVKEKGKDNILGVLAARIDLKNSLYKMLLDRVGLGKTGETLIVNKDVIAINQLRWHENAPLNLQINAEPAVKAAQGKTGITITEDYRGENVLAAYTFIPETGWGFVCKQDLYELNEPVRDMINNFLVLFFLSALMIYLATYFISKTISIPIISMNETSKKIMAGDLTVRNKIFLKDEVGSLAESINLMTQTLDTSITVQKGVAEISRIIIGHSNIRNFADELLKQLLAVTGANIGAFYVLNDLNSQFEHLTSIGANTELVKPFKADIFAGEIGITVLEKKINLTKDIPADTIFNFQTFYGEARPKEIITIPILIENNVVAIISLSNLAGFTPEGFEIIQQAWLSINSSYSSLIANERTRILADNLARVIKQIEAQTDKLHQQSEELKERNIELEFQRKEVNEANRLKSEFLSNMSHELRTPLNSVIALSRLLMEDSKNEFTGDNKKFLEIIARNGKLLLNLINEILDLSKIEAGKMEINISEFDLCNCINNVIESLAVSAEEKGISIGKNYSVPELKIKSDQAKITHILQNLINNAVKFTNQGEVIINLKTFENNFIIEIKDSGIGIPENEIDFIFDEFRQVDGSNSRNFEGTGLGLSIVNKYVNLLKGQIDVKSKLGQGSVFFIKMPINLDLTDVDFIRKETKILDRNNLKESFQTGELKKVLLIEDNEIAAMQIRKMLEKNNCHVTSAFDGREALELIKTSEFDAIILDLMLPEVNGFEVLIALRENITTRKVPVLVITAKKLTEQDLEKLAANNIYELIIKGDINQADLTSSINRMFEIKKKSSHGKRKIKSPARNKPVILYIEDNEDNIKTVQAILKNKYQLEIALDGEMGLELANSLNPDIILLDIALPKKDGFEVLNELKNNKNLEAVPVIAVTSSAMKGDRENILSKGFDDYLSKPIDIETFLKRIIYYAGENDE